MPIVLPETIAVQSKTYIINTDFRHWVKFGQLFSTGELTAFEKIHLSVRNIYGDPPPQDMKQALEQALLFYACGRESPDRSQSRERLIDFDADWMRLWADFKIWCRIDLNKIKYLHWWQFMALLDALPEDASIKHIMSLRGMDLTRIIDPKTRAEYERMKQSVALDSMQEESMDEFYKHIFR